MTFVTPIIKNHSIAHSLLPEVAGLTCCTPVFSLLLISFFASMKLDCVLIDVKPIITHWSPDRLTTPPRSSVLLERSNGGVREWAGKPRGKSSVNLSRDFVARVVLFILSLKRDSSVKVLSVGFSSLSQFTRMLSHLWILWQRQHLYSELF